MINLHASPIEWVFLSTTILLSVYTTFALYTAITDAAFLLANGVNGPRSIIATQNIREEAIKLGISVVMIGVSLPSLFLQPPPPPYALVPQSLLATCGWCLVAGLMIISSALSRMARRRLQKLAPVEVKKTVAVIPATDSNGSLAERAVEARANAHVRSNERKVDRGS